MQKHGIRCTHALYIPIHTYRNMGIYVHRQTHFFST